MTYYTQVLCIGIHKIYIDFIRVEGSQVYVYNTTFMFQLDVCDADPHLRGVTYGEYVLRFHRVPMDDCAIPEH